MDYEQKYKEANEKVAARFGFNVAKQIFSDLYESEDESRITTICTYLQDYARLSGSESRTIRINKYCDWLKSLKDRVQPQPKQEWSEEDETIKTIKCALLSCCKGSLYNYELSYDGYEKCLSRLASLIPQNSWKPSDKQMKALKEAVDEHFDIDGGALWHLYEDLKKL